MSYEINNNNNNNNNNNYKYYYPFRKRVKTGKVTQTFKGKRTSTATCLIASKFLCFFFLFFGETCIIAKWINKVNEITIINVMTLKGKDMIN